jgi:hypothetical protein
LHNKYHQTSIPHEGVVGRPALANQPTYELGHGHARVLVEVTKNGGEQCNHDDLGDGHLAQPGRLPLLAPPDVHRYEVVAEAALFYNKKAYEIKSSFLKKL